MSSASGNRSLRFTVAQHVPSRNLVKLVGWPARRPIKELQSFAKEIVRGFGPGRQPFLVLKVSKLFGYRNVNELIKRNAFVL